MYELILKLITIAGLPGDACICVCLVPRTLPFVSQAGLFQGRGLGTRQCVCLLCIATIRDGSYDHSNKRPSA